MKAGKKLARKIVKPDAAENEHKSDDRPIALTYFLIGVVLLAITGYFLIWLLRPLPAIRGSGFAWLAVPEQPGFATKEVDLTLQVELVPDGNPLIEYDILAPCGNKSTTVALYLSGLSRLTNIRLFTLGEERTVSGVIPELGYQSGMQLITGTIVDGAICNHHTKGIGAATALVIQGTSIAPLAFHNYSQSEIAVPIIGYPWDTNMIITAAPGLRGSWSSPLKSKVKVSVSPLQLQDRIDISHPATETGASLDWSASNTLGVSAIWTDTAADRRVQIYIFILGIFGGIGGTFVVEGVEPVISLLLKKGTNKVRRTSRSSLRK